MATDHESQFTWNADHNSRPPPRFWRPTSLLPAEIFPRGDERTMSEPPLGQERRGGGGGNVARSIAGATQEEAENREPRHADVGLPWQRSTRGWVSPPGLCERRSRVLQGHL